jgi:hypothetical protein
MIVNFHESEIVFVLYSLENYQKSLPRQVQSILDKNYQQDLEKITQLMKSKSLYLPKSMVISWV